MEVTTLIENQDSIDEEIYKLSFKELKQLAIRRNINPKLKKAQLVRALLGTGESICDKIEHKNHSATRRVTRARASILKNIDNTLSYPIVTNTNNIEKNSIIGTYQTSQTLEKECKTKSRRKQSKCVNGEDNCNSTVKALSEITNTEALCDSLKGNALYMNDNSKFTGKEVVSKEQVTNACISENDSVNCNQKVSSKRRGTKKKNVHESNNDMVNIEINCIEDESNVEARTVKLEDVPEPKKTKRGRRGKNLNVSDLVIKNDPSISSSPSLELHTEKRLSRTQTKAGENTSLKASTCPIPENNCETSSSSGIVESAHSDLSSDSCVPTSEHELLRETSQSSNKVENMPVLAPLVRSSTFVLEDKDGNSNEGLRRSNTFTISEEGAKSPKAQLTFTASTDSKIKNVTPDKNVSKFTKSIGSRIISSSKKLSSVKSAGKQPGQGSTVKKTITKSTATPGSMYKNKFGVSKKAPNFKVIHQKLFGNMESLTENHKRRLEKAKALIQSPVPRCASLISSPKWELKKKNEIIIKPGIPQKNQTPVRDSPLVSKSKTPIANKISTTVPKSTSINRFGFNKKRINREVASTIVGTKTPQVNLEKRKDEDRALIQGVRVNKRFMLQMKMRQNKE